MASNDVIGVLIIGVLCGFATHAISLLRELRKRIEELTVQCQRQAEATEGILNAMDKQSTREEPSVRKARF